MAAILAKILEGEITLRDLEDTSQIDRKQVGCLDNTYLQRNSILGVLIPISSVR